MILDVCSYDGPDTVGGPYAWLRRMPLALRERGHEIRVHLFSWQDPETGAGASFLREQGIPVSAFPFEDTRSNIRHLLEAAAPAPPDVFVANHVVPAYYASAWFRKAGIPTIGIFRSDEPFYHDLARRFVHGPRPFRLSAAVAVSRHLESLIAAKVSADTTVRWIPSGTPLPETTVFPPADTFRIAYVGRLVEKQKRIGETLEALLRVTAEVPGTEAVFYGDGPEREGLEERIRSAEATERIRLAGAVPAEEITDHLLRCHAVVLLSDHEGTPTALKEAMACGCVPVAFRLRSGIPDLVKDGVHGLLVDDRGDAVVDAIRRLRRDANLWKRLSDAARTRVEEQFSVDHCADAWCDLLEQLAADAGPRGALPLSYQPRLPRPLAGFRHQDIRPAPSPNPARRARRWLGAMRRKISLSPVN